MKIGIDLDGVVFNTEMLWTVYAELYDTLELKRNSIVNPDEARVQEIYNWTKEEERKYFDKYVYIKEFDLVPGAKEVLNLLHKDRLELIVITARGKTNPKQKEWAMKKLEKEGIIFDKYYFCQTEKVDVCIKEKIDIMIDDNYYICKKMSEKGIKTLYFHSMNRKHINDDENIHEVCNWGEIYRYIHDCIKLQQNVTG